MNQSVLDTGSAVGDLAMGVFGDLGDMISKTKQLIEARTPIITEASFSIDGLFCSVDILKVFDENVVELYEVKSSTSVHDIYYHDAAFQCCVLNKLGYKVRACNIVHINNQYERNGDLNINELFTVEDITTDAMLLRRDVEANIDEIREYIKQTQEPTDEFPVECIEDFEARDKYAEVMSQEQDEARYFCEIIRKSEIPHLFDNNCNAGIEIRYVSAKEFADAIEMPKGKRDYLKRYFS